MSNTISELPENPTIQDYKRYDGTLYVRNHSIHAVTCNTMTERFILNPSGSDGDCQVLPMRCLDEVGFQKMIFRGQLSVSPEYADYANSGAARMEEAEKKRHADIAAMTEENSSAKDLVPTKCLVCSADAFQTRADIDTLVPPLCGSHKSQESSFIGTPVQNEDGTTGVKFAPLPNRS